MAHIVFDLSSVESKSRFSEAVSDVLDLTETVTEKLLEKTKEKARVLELARPHYHEILLKLLHERGGMGFSCVITVDGEPALLCESCNAVTQEVVWLCASCGSPMQKCDVTRLKKVNASGEAERFVRESEKTVKTKELEQKNEKERLTREEEEKKNIASTRQLEQQRTEYTEDLVANHNKFTCPETGMEFVLVKGGVFQMGDVFDEGDDDEKPTHHVELDDFYMGKYQVTEAEWDIIMGSNSPDFEGCNPVQNISWDDSQEFIMRLNDRHSRLLQYRLPTEAEWEYAAREGGRKVRFGTGGNNITASSANFNWQQSSKKDFRGTTPVGSFAANALGLCEMSGNVWEWCMDWYDKKYYSMPATRNPQGPENGKYRVLRGGAWNNDPEKLRASCRGKSTPSRRLEVYSFRLVFSVPRN